MIGSQVLRPTARGEIGETVTFDAEAWRYDLILNRNELEFADFVERTVGRTDCVITLADGSTATVDGARQVIILTGALAGVIAARLIRSGVRGRTVMMSVALAAEP